MKGNLDDLENLPNPHVHGERGHTGWSCADGSLNIFDLLRPGNYEKISQGTPCARRRRKNEEAIIEENNTEDFWSATGDVIYRHHEVPRMEIVCSEGINIHHIPFSDVRRQARTRIHCAAEHIVTGYGHEEREISLSESMDRNNKIFNIEDQATRRIQVG